MHYYNEHYISSDYLLEDGFFLPNDISVSESIEEENCIIPKFKIDTQYNNINFNEEFFLQKMKNIEKEKNDFVNIINSKNWEEKTKIKFICLTNEYKNFWISQVNYQNSSDKKQENINHNINFFSFIEPNNIYYFLKKEKKYNRLNLEKHLHMFLGLIRIYHKDNSLDYNILKNTDISFISKKEISDESVIQYIKYLQKYNLLEELLIFELIVKYKIGIGIISKIKYENYKFNKLIIKNKNNKIVILNDKKFINRLKKLIKINKIKKDDFIFYTKKRNQNFKYRENYCVKQFKRNIDKSRIFLNYNGKNITSENFRKINLSEKKYESIFYNK